MLIEIQQRMPSIFMKLFQRRLLDRHAEITEEEIHQAYDEIETYIHVLQLKLDDTKEMQKILRTYMNSYKGGQNAKSEDKIG